MTLHFHLTIDFSKEFHHIPLDDVHVVFRALSNCYSDLRGCHFRLFSACQRRIVVQIISSPRNCNVSRPCAASSVISLPLFPTHHNLCQIYSVLRRGPVLCDVVILRGESIVVDESALTGEATPVSKKALDVSMANTTFSSKRHATNSILAGTDIQEVDDGGLGLVVNTGSFTNKGDLLTGVLSYGRHKPLFEDDVQLVVILLAVETAVLIGLVFDWLGSNWVRAYFDGTFGCTGHVSPVSRLTNHRFAVIFIVSSILHPLIPTTFVVTVGIAAQRLQSKQISSIQPDSLLVAAKCDVAFFDKTGTLTKQGMDFESIQCPNDKDQVRRKLCSIGIAVCHTLATTSKGEIVGTQVDMAAFKSTGATLARQKGQFSRVIADKMTYTILREFEFDNERKTQSVVVKDDTGAMYAFVKGSPEAIQAASLPYTVPKTFDKAIEKAAESAVYQLAIAFKFVAKRSGVTDYSDFDRGEIESSLFFGGFLHFRNTLREDSPAVLQELKDAQIATAMITGDNVLTGIAVAKEAGMIAPNEPVLIGKKVSRSLIAWVNTENSVDVRTNEQILEELSLNDVNLAITGAAWHVLCKTNPEQAVGIGKNVRVFGRCDPSDKVSVVTFFSEQGHVTLMCGDGQNDCGSLKAASVGIALSSAEASIVAPFTSLDKSITAVTDVIREGRCASASAIASYSSYLLYGQLTALLVALCAYFDNWIDKNAWVFLDCVWSTTLGFSIPLATSAKRLSPRSPTSSLLSQETIASVGGTLLWHFLFLSLGFIALWNQDWFSCRKISSNSEWAGVDAYETQVMFLIVAFQVIINGAVLNFGYSFRASWYKNYVLNMFAFAWFVFILVFTLLPSKFSCFVRVNCVNEVSTIA
jgi:predicted P-type ATPase